jgi:hypothetical protein
MQGGFFAPQQKRIAVLHKYCRKNTQTRMKNRPKRANFGKGMDFSEEYAILEIKISLI